MIKKSAFILVVCFQLFAVNSLAQEKFDIVTFTISKNWQKTTNPNSLSLLKTDGTGGNGLISIFKSVPVDLGSKVNFLIWWNDVVRKVVNTTETPQMQPVTDLNGWKVECGMAQYTSANQALNLGKGMALLCSFSGNNSMVNVLAISNTKQMNDEIFDFIDSIKMPPINLPELVEPIKDVHGIWERTSSARPSYADAVNWGKSGYTKSRYDFAYGKYTYAETSFSDSFPQIITVEETGDYDVVRMGAKDLKENEVRLRPAKSTISHYSKKNGVNELGKLLKTENRALETVKYNFAFHYFEDVKKWKLVLRNDAPTKRDGAFSDDKTFKNAWYFDDKYLESDAVPPPPKKKEQ